MITPEKIAALQKELYEHGLAQMMAKGNDYSGSSHKDGDTFKNIRIAAEVGLVSNVPQSVMVRLMDKVMRMVSLCDPSVSQQVKDESLFDTVSDLWNYASYYLILMREMKEKENAS